MNLTTIAVGTAYALGVVGLALFGFASAAEPAGAPLGFVVGILSAIAWALSTIASPEWNTRLNLFAALFAACSLGFLAPAERVCNGYLLPFLCR